MIDTSEWPGIFFYLTIGSVVVLNSNENFGMIIFSKVLLLIYISVSNGIYQNTVYGIAAKMPFSHTGAVVLGTVSTL